MLHYFQKCQFQLLLMQVALQNFMISLILYVGPCFYPITKQQQKVSTCMIAASPVSEIPTVSVPQEMVEQEVKANYSENY